MRLEPGGGTDTDSLICSSTPGAKLKRCHLLADSLLPPDLEGERDEERLDSGEPSKGIKDPVRSVASTSVPAEDATAFEG